MHSKSETDLLHILEERGMLPGRDDAVSQRAREPLYPTLHLGDVAVFTVDDIVNRQLSFQIGLRVILERHFVFYFYCRQTSSDDRLNQTYYKGETFQNECT